MSIRKHQLNRRRLGAWQLVLVLMALLASSAQQVVAQSHWHAAVAATAVDGNAASLPPDTRPVHDDCLWCQLATHASAVIPPSAVLRFAFVEEFTSPVSPQLPLDFPVQPAHAWQSRGPPPV
jgi:hypothetical protein